MNKRNLSLLSVTSVILFSAPVFGQVVSGGATGSIGGSISGTLERPSAIDRMHSERDRIGQTGVSVARKARQSAEATTGGARDRAADSKEDP